LKFIKILKKLSAKDPIKVYKDTTSSLGEISTNYISNKELAFRNQKNK
jgi:hypothetical protein